MAIIIVLFIAVVAFNSKVRYVQVIDNEAVNQARNEIKKLNRQLQEVSECEANSNQLQDQCEQKVGQINEVCSEKVSSLKTDLSSSQDHCQQQISEKEANY